MDIVRDSKIDWLSYKWVFIGLSIVLLTAGGFSLASRGLNLGVDFSGGTLVYVKFADAPQLDQIRSVLDGSTLKAEGVTRFDEPEKNEVQIRLARVETEEAQDLTEQNRLLLEVLRSEFDQDRDASKADLNNASTVALSQRLQELDPDNLRAESDSVEFQQHYEALARRVIELRNDQGGIFSGFEAVRQSDLPETLKTALESSFYLGSFNLISVESVGPKVGQELRQRARDAIMLSLVGMLLYIAYRFRTIHGFAAGVAAIIALFHDVFITLGFFSIFYKEISLTVVAAVLTLVGYSINDTIVVFDRVRENLRLMRRQDLATVINTSINQTLNRTILTSGMTFLAAFSLYLFGGPVLNGFSFALVVGIIVGTYSSIAIASPIVLWWQNVLDARKARRRGPV